MLKKALSTAVLAATLTQGGAANAAHHEMMMQPKTVQDWWPNIVNLQPLRKNEAVSDPMGADFDYAEAFASVDIDTLYAEIEELLTAANRVCASRSRKTPALTILKRKTA